ncbi:MAG: DUF4445 domain-containing protein [Coriobacteriia bacterium]|nr:DUF4445 domain-containing protein [Coriobacteriia bacterium]
MTAAFVRFGEGGPAVRVPVGVTLREAASAAGVTLDAPCGGLGRCGRCRVRVSGAVGPPDPTERSLLIAEELAAGVRLACRARVDGDAVVAPPAREGLRALDFGVSAALVVEPPEERGLPAEGPALGAAVDIGTTTVACLLAELRTGTVLGTAAALNPQVAEGHDVMSRVGAALGGKAAELKAAATGAVEGLALGLLRDSGTGPEALLEMVVAGNTAMLGLFLGEDVSPLSASPYQGAFVASTAREARSLGMPALRRCRVLTLPGASAFVGADLTAGLLATGLAGRDETAVLVDLGTNGEMLLRAPGVMIATSAAAGPALEGATVSCGMRAEAGAIERVEWASGDLAFTTIAEERPAGLCGSGLLDLVAVLLEAGALDSSGRLAPAPGGALGRRVTEAGGRTAIRLAGGTLLTQGDVRQVQLAKGAVRAGLDLLLAEARVDAGEIARVLVAGGFGLHVRPSALTRMGLLPAVWEDRVVFAGNTALSGALRALLSASARAEADALASSVRTLDPAAHPEFQRRFIERLALERDADRPRCGERAGEGPATVP